MSHGAMCLSETELSLGEKAKNIHSYIFQSRFLGLVRYESSVSYSDSKWFYLKWPLLNVLGSESSPFYVDNSARTWKNDLWSTCFIGWAALFLNL